MEEASRLLANGMAVADAAMKVGYSNPSKFAAAFKREHDESPRNWLRERRMNFGEDPSSPM